MNRRSLLQLGSALTLGGCATAPVATTQKVQSETRRVDELRLFIAQPERATDKGIILLPTIAGLNPYTRETANAFAAEGIAAIVWDPYNGEDAPAEVEDRLIRSKKVTDTVAVRDLRRTMDYAHQNLGLRHVGAMGWCLGGRFSLIFAAQDSRVKAVCCYNPTVYADHPVMLLGRPTSRADFPGQTMDEMVLARTIACPVQIARPGHDYARPEEYAELQAALYARAAATRIDYYPEATHGFTYTPEPPANIAAERSAWASTIAFLRIALA